MGKKSKFKESEILGRLPDGTIILKEGVRRRPKRYGDDEESYINMDIIYLERWQKVMDKLYGNDGEPLNPKD